MRSTKKELRVEKEVQKLLKILEEAKEKSELSTKKGVRKFYKFIRRFKKLVKHGLLPAEKAELSKAFTNAGAKDSDIADPFEGGVKGLVDYLLAFI